MSDSVDTFVIEFTQTVVFHLSSTASKPAPRHIRSGFFNSIPHSTSPYTMANVNRPTLTLICVNLGYAMV
jgi:hypothetical protein